jgi:hypothetical protein
MQKIIRIQILIVSLVFAGCGDKKHLTANDLNAIASTDSDITEEIDAIVEDPTSSLPTSFKPLICSDLSFDHVQWPKGTDEFYATVFGLAMNITGSFEGHDGWENISNNFDGQGLSLGLFNQNLGQGSLQPLMIQLRRNYLSKMKTFFSTSQLSSVESMLVKWNGAPVTSVMGKALSQNLDPYENFVSPLDDPALLEAAGEPTFLQSKASSTRNGVSVNWATSNLYSGTKFKSDWLKSLTKMSGSPEYISLQIEAAKYIHNRAMNYMIKFNLKELRSYLFLFDIVVQNGSLTTSIENKYIAWEKSNKNASELTKMKQMLEYRLTLVIAKYRNDVRARKTAVLTGTGTVHGSKRDFKKEYCAPSWATTFSQKITLK